MGSAKKIKEIFTDKPWLYLAIAGILLGVVLASQFNSSLPRIISPAVSIVAQEEMLSNLESEQISLKEQLVLTENQIDQLNHELKNKQSGLTEKITETEKLKLKAGISQLTGEGIVVLLDDNDQRRDNPNSIAHASDMRDLVDHLWTSGAQAISIEGAGQIQERIGPSTSIDCIVNTVLINNTKIVPPFKIKAIGVKEALISAIEDKKSLKLIYDRVDKEGLKFEIIEKSDNITIPKFTGSIIFEHVKI